MTYDSILRALPEAQSGRWLSYLSQFLTGAESGRPSTDYWAHITAVLALRKTHHCSACIRSMPVAEGILAGSRELEEEFVGRFLPRLQAFFRARVSQSDLSDELIQETLVAALLALRTRNYGDTSAIDAFVEGIFRNQLAEALRVGAKYPTGAASDQIYRAASAPGLDPALRLTVQNELNELSAVDRRILWLILIEGFRPAEVASQIFLNEEVVRQRKWRICIA